MRLYLVLAMTLAAGCQPEGTPLSATKIRGGSAVAAGATGPERVSTVALAGVTHSEQFTCSAALIAPSLLLTAAHCIEAGATLYAFFGLDLSQGTDGGTVVKATNALVHPDYAGSDSGELEPHDIALVRLAHAAPAGYRPVAVIPTAATIPAPSEVLLAGFGITERGEDDGLLRSVRTTYTGQDGDGRLLIEDPRKRGACSGDSGGPLYAEVGGAWYLAGVLSGGPIPCRGINLYTAVQAHQDFIKSAEERL